MIAVYDRIQWIGPSVGIGVLRACGPHYDIERSGVRSTYLTETYARASSYAQRLGGEVLTALVDALRDLEVFSRDRDVRLRHARRFVDEVAKGYPDGSDHEWAMSVVSACTRAGWLQEENARLAPLLQRLLAVQREHEPIVYAIAVDKELLRGAIHSDPMGLRISRWIPPERIMAKAVGVTRREPRPGEAHLVMEGIVLAFAWGRRVAAVNGPDSST